MLVPIASDSAALVFVEVRQIVSISRMAGCMKCKGYTYTLIEGCVKKCEYMWWYVQSDINALM